MEKRVKLFGYRELGSRQHAFLEAWDGGTRPMSELIIAIRDQVRCRALKFCTYRGGSFVQ